MPSPTGNSVVDWLAVIVFFAAALWAGVGRPVTRALGTVEETKRELHAVVVDLQLHKDLTEYQADQLRAQGIPVPYVIPPQLRRANP